MQLLQEEYAKLEKTKRAQLPSPPSEIPASIHKMLKLQSSVITVQSWWRKVLTLKNLQKDAMMSKAALKARLNQCPEEVAMREFAQQLKAKKLTPEMFFRICDTEYKQSVTVNAFKDMLQTLNIQLSRAQMSRLIMILDEDIEGHITLEEFNNGLEAYCVSGERHKPLDGQALYHPFEHRCLFKLITELNKKNITFLEMFNACDVNDDARVNLSEIRNFVEGLSPDFKQKEVHSLMNYLDIDKRGVINKDDFTR
jgi:Ca2+-binding EF-hand superfamily protein